MSKSRPTLGHYLAYGGFRLFETVLALLPLGLCATLGALMGRVAHCALPPYRRLVRRNLRIAFEGECTEGEIRDLAAKHFATLGANLLSSIKLTTMRGEDVVRRLEVVGVEKIQPVVEEGRGIIYLISHLGAWEILAQVGAIAPQIERSTLYQPLSNPLLDAHVRGRRERLGTKTFDRKDGFNAPIQLVRSGGGVGVLVDQHAGDKGTWCPFFGRLASTSNLAPLMAARTGAAMFPIGVATVDRGRWRMTVGDAISVGRSERVELATARMNLEVEKVIRASPEDWFWVHNRWKIPHPRFLLNSYRRGITLPPGMGVGDLKRFRIVVRSPNPLGDACMSVPAVRAIKRGRPDCELAVLCPENLVGFWGRVSDVDTVIPRPKSASNRAVGKSLSEAGPFDVAVLLPNSPRSAIEAKHAHIPRIVGYPAKWRDRLVDQKIPPRDATAGPRPHHANHYLKIARCAGADLSDKTIFDPPHADGEQTNLLIGISAGAEYGPAKCWPPERFVEAAQKVTATRPAARFVLFGTKGEASIGEQLMAGLGGHAENRIGKTDLEGLMDELHRCAALITNDTGTMHLAAFLGVPVVAIFGSTEPAWTGPIGKRHEVLRHHVPCSPCFLRECPLDFRCMRAIEPEEVADAVGRILGSATDSDSANPDRDGAEQ